METQNNNQKNNLGNQALRQTQPQGLGQASPTPPKGKKLKTEFLVIIILLIIAAVVVYLYNHKQLNRIASEIKPVVKQEQKKIVVTPGLPEGVTLSPLPAGQLPADFPKDLIIYPKVQNIQSSRNILASNELHLSVQYQVASVTPQQVTEKYQTALLAKKWKVVASGNYDKDYYVSMTGAAGTADAGSVTVTVAPNETGSTVNIDYSPLPKK